MKTTAVTGMFQGVFHRKQPESNKMKNQTMKPSWLSVGLKMVIGVGLVSNLCIGMLVYMNFKAFSQVGEETNQLMAVMSDMNDNLRTSIFDLQKKYLEIPKLLQVDPAREISDWIHATYTVETEDILEGRENYGKLFKRRQRRDISKGRFVVQEQDGMIVVSRGILDKDGTFTETVVRLGLASSQPDQDMAAIASFIEAARQNAEKSDALKQKVVTLKSLLADEGLAAETARNEILYRVEEIEQKKTDLIRFRQDRLNTISLMAVSAMIINLLMVHIVAWAVVGRPLKMLTLVIGRINNGETVDIPYQHRKDRIGILAHTLKNFQGALVNLRKADQRKKAEREMIQELIQKMTGLIQGLQHKADDMKDNAVELSSLASDTESQTETATESAARTVDQTDTVSYSAQQLQTVVADISRQITRQNELVGAINDVITASREDIGQLTNASTEINEIVAIVKNIAGETKLLALNARIEAARSGDAGKGFAVVAREVRELSEQTEEANQDIASKIDSIQAASHTMIDHTQEIEARIQRLMEASRQIAAAVEEQRSVTSGIAENTQATGVDIKDVSRRILQVKETARSTSRFAHDVRSLSGEIAGELSTLLAETMEKLSQVTDDGHSSPGNGSLPNSGSSFPGGGTSPENFRTETHASGEAAPGDMPVRKTHDSGSSLQAA